MAALASDAAESPQSVHVIRITPHVPVNSLRIFFGSGDRDNTKAGGETGEGRVPVLARVVTSACAATDGDGSKTRHSQLQ
ncbi:hypothetical protein RMSM_03341 [Rhodopirellula maiorica SM1]|uniref:Uncharacterized protein n=1 Tax=Rhodopirellula maiorica SM1 TaxID=1265738 RepID=M5RK98_9BACT|nr:hypothetical protein RMSM_03341 [Rhodopirellula maiorica SM1]